jgi:serine/threonine protein kinase
MEEAASFKNVLDCGGRGTFVGTPLYVAPEMIAWSFSGPFTDLWALGCIIYQCLTGKPPFNTKSANQIFQLIQERNIEFPKTMPVEAQDLIDKLMQLDPF